MMFKICLITFYRVLTSKEAQTEIDYLYDYVCDVYYAEMNALLNYKDVGPASHKRGRHSAKPFWQTNYLYYGKMLKNLKKYLFNTMKYRKSELE